MNELYELTNPVFNTAKMTLTLLSAVGNEDSIAFEKALGFEQMPHVDAKGKEYELLKRIGAITIELRYALANRLIEQAGNKNVLDLACGYTPKAKYLMDRGYNYVGGDLPAVVEDMARVSKELLGGKALFRAVDVTNGESVAAAAAQLPEGPVTIDCEGLVAYLDKNEMTAMVRNFASLLAQRGGCWVTTDFESDHYFLAIIQAVTGGQGEKFLKLVNSQVNKKTADADHAPVFANDEEKVTFLESMGLSVERRPITGVANMGLRTLCACTPEQRAAIAAALEKINVWIMTPSGAKAAQPAGTGAGGLAIDQDLNGDALTVRLAGRMDSISAPALLNAFWDIPTAVKDITLDLKNLEYTSSAGLRVMLIMYKQMGEGHFRLTNVNAAVAAILEDTGFSQFFVSADGALSDDDVEAVAGGSGDTGGQIIFGTLSDWRP